jgi:hypothetical protein
VELLLKLLSVFVIAAVELWAAIPAGLALGLHPVLTGVTVAGGAILGTFVVVFIGGRFRNWLVRRQAGKEGEKQPGLIHRIWKRYGTIGLGMLAPLLTGAPLGAALGMALGAPAGRLMMWMSLGIILWTAILTTIGALGRAGIEALGH